MRVSLPRAALRRILRWTQFVLFGGTALLLLYCGFVVLDAWSFEKTQSRRLDEMISGRQAIAASLSLPASPAVLPIPPPAMDGLVGRIEIARLGISVMVFEGTTTRTLRRAAGHIDGTALPGQQGNIGISAHRDTFFRPLRNVRENDLIALTTPGGSYRYRVISTEIVSPADVGVLRDDGGEALTLITCYPFYFVGAAPQRFVVRALRVAENNPVKASGAAAEN